MFRVQRCLSAKQDEDTQRPLQGLIQHKNPVPGSVTGPDLTSTLLLSIKNTQAPETASDAGAGCRGSDLASSRSTQQAYGGGSVYELGYLLCS